MVTALGGRAGLFGHRPARPYARDRASLGLPLTTAETPVLNTLADLTALSLERCALAPRELMLARIAALIAVDAPPVSYMANAGAAADTTSPVMTFRQS